MACGETVTTDFRLTGKLVCPESEPALVIGADGIEVNLAHHGVETGFAPGFDSIGIDNRGGYDDVTVRDGGISGYGNPIVWTGDRGALRRVSAIGITGVTWGGSDGLLADVSAGSFSALSLGGSNNRVVRGDFFANQNVVVTIGGVANRLTHSNISAGAESWGLQINNASDTHIAYNTFLGQTGVLSNGIDVVDKATSTRLIGNRVEGWGNIGILVESPATLLRGNSANSNEHVGIDAVSGVTDGGGNTASGNGDTQCVNLFCE